MSRKTHSKVVHIVCELNHCVMLDVPPPASCQTNLPAHSHARTLTHTNTHTHGSVGSCNDLPVMIQLSCYGGAVCACPAAIRSLMHTSQHQRTHSVL